MATRDETETVIQWAASDDRVTVYSLMPKIWRMCERAGGEEIRVEEGIRDGKKEARTFLVDSGCIRIRPRRKASPAQLAAAEAGRQAAKQAKEGI